MVSVFDFLDYRCFLKKRFFELKQERPGFSYRSFNRSSGLKSSGYLKLVMDGKRNLAQDGIRMIARGFRLGEGEREYFENLVHFNQAKDHEEKNRYFKELSKNKKFLAAKPLSAAQFKLFSCWYYVAILEAVRIETDELKDAKWLQKILSPPVPLREIKQAVQELEQLNLLVEDSSGNLQAKESMLTTEDEVESLNVVNFHQEMCKKASRALLEEDSQDREFSGLTVATSEQGFQKAKQEIQSFRKRLHSILEQEDSGPKILVGQINLQLFKLSKGG